MLKGFSFGSVSAKAAMAAVLLLVGSGFVSASDDEVLMRIMPAGSVCIEGQECKKPMAKKVAVASEAAPAEAQASEEAAPEVAMAAKGATGEDTFNSSCTTCHTSGVAGAPKIGDAAAWATRSEKGLDGMFDLAKKGVNAMPPMGMCMTCTDDELKAAISYMVDKSK